MREKLAAFSASALPVLGLWLFGLLLTVGVFNGGFWAVIGIAGAVAAAVLLGLATRKFPCPREEILFMGLAFLGLAVVAAAQSPFSSIAFKAALQWATILVPLSFLTVPQVAGRFYHPKMVSVLPYVFILALLALALELAGGLPLLTALHAKKLFPYFYNRGFSYAMIMVWPFAGFLWCKGKKQTAVLLLAATVPALLLTESRATKLATLLALGACVVSAVWPLLVLRGLQAVLILSAAWPWGAQWLFATKREWVAKLPVSWGDRTEIWDYFSYRIEERFLKGWGMGVDHKLPFMEPNGAFYIYREIPASHPHNAFVQLWVEAGIWGAFMGLLFGWLTLKWVAGLPARLRPFGFAVWTGCLALTLCAYDFSTDSLWAMFAMVSLALTMFSKQLD